MSPKAKMYKIADAPHTSTFTIGLPYDVSYYGISITEFASRSHFKITLKEGREPSSKVEELKAFSSST